MSQSRRFGVTLLEVIVSMGIMVVGLMGMASLIPLGRLELAEGDRLDNSSTLGRGAFRELTVRGYLNPQMWVDPLTGASVAGPQSFVVNPQAVGPPFAPIVVDPLMVAPRFFGETPNATALTSREESHRTNCRFFPYSLALPGSQSGWPEKTAPKIARVTLRTYPADSSSGGSLAHTMRFDVASRFFRSTDDLVIDLPTDRARRPAQIFMQSDMTNLSVTANDGVTDSKALPQVAYRKFRGDYSWFFVVEPNPAERYTSPSDNLLPMTAGGFGSPYVTRAFRVWVVVCNKRDLRDTSDMSLAASRAVGERCVWIDFIDRYTARLRASGLIDEGTASQVLDAKANQWIAATSAYTNPMVPGGKQYLMEWFRIVNVADRAQQHEGSDVWYREVSLAGRDMVKLGSSSMGLPLEDADAFKYQDMTYDESSGVEPLTAWGTLIPGVRGVYEKSIYLDRPSLWTTQ